MEELINTVLAVRTEERRESFHSLVKIVSDSDQSEELFQLYAITESSESAVDCFTEFEDHILKLTDEVLARMGVHVDYDFINHNPDAIVALFKLMDDLEEYENIDALLTIVASEEDNHIILRNLAMCLEPEEGFDYTGAFESLEDRFIKRITENIVGRKKDLENELYFAERGKRLLNFLIDNPEVPFYNVFESYMSLTSPEMMANAFNFEENPVELTKELITTLSVGVLIGTTDTRVRAVSAAESVVTLIDNDEIFQVGDYIDIRSGVVKYYEPEVEEHE